MPNVTSGPLAEQGINTKIAPPTHDRLAAWRRTLSRREGRQVTNSEVISRALDALARADQATQQAS